MLIYYLFIYFYLFFQPLMYIYSLSIIHYHCYYCVGYTVLHLRCSYGESVFINAVYSGLAECHYIIKLYKPCGIVCPYHPTTNYSDNNDESSDEYYDDDDDSGYDYEVVDYKL